MAIELDPALVRLDQPGDHVEHRGLASPIRTKEPHGLAAAHINARPANHLAIAKALLELKGGQIPFARRLARKTVVAALGGLPAAGRSPCRRPSAGGTGLSDFGRD